VSSFTSKQLRVKLILASQNSVFPGPNSNTLVLTNLRMTVVVQGAAKIAAQADLQIFGMLKEDMNALTVIFGFKGSELQKNLLIVESNDGEGFSQVFSGTIQNAQPEYRGSPNTFFRIGAQTGYIEGLMIDAAASYPGDTDVGGMVQSIATAMGFKFENNGVNKSLSTPHLWGSYFDQLKQLAESAQFDYYLQGDTLAICPPNGLRTNIPPVLLNKGSGLIGYPVLQPAGVSVECLYNPAILGGGLIEVDSDIPNANGHWLPYQLTHQLQCNTPHGAWFSQLNCCALPSAA
jgi:hypothetical protein